MPAQPVRILILTAAFGEGHNSAARNLALALQSHQAETLICDPCLNATPILTRLLARLYRFATDCLPKAWEAIYHSIDRFDFNAFSSLLTRQPENLIANLIREFQPHAIVSTYPLYPYLLHRILTQHALHPPVFTVVTDSIAINSAWLRAPSSHWLVTDPATRSALIAYGLAPDTVVDTGFPVHPLFSTLPPLPPTDPCQPFRILFFPTSRRHQLASMGSALLEASPQTQLTIVLGKNVRTLYPHAKSLKSRFPNRVRLLGWTRKIPQLLTQHHLVVGKAGGATVHEAIAARCPMLIHHLVPGQEEGNLELLRSIGAGNLARSPHALAQQVQAMLAHNASPWRTMKQALIHHNRNAGALTAAQFILNHTPSPR